jgi:CheY-like chemotaxis protein
LARKILLADDSVTAQNMGRKILTDAGYEVVTVNNGSAALKKILETKPDLVVLDVYMPGYSGLEVCQRIKENKDCSRIPILLTVGKLEPFKPEEARRVRADAFVIKPFEASELLAALARLEDKIVPQPEPYKPGRFAKAVAAVDDIAGVDKDESWKARLRIPTHAPEEATTRPDAAAAAPEKGFRGFSGTDASKKATPPQREGVFEPPLPSGLPSDITPEEIAAITAAAAQLRGTASHPPLPDLPAPPRPPIVAEVVPPGFEQESSPPVTFASAPEAPAPSDGISLAQAGGNAGSEPSDVSSAATIEIPSIADVASRGATEAQPAEVQAATEAEPVSSAAPADDIPTIDAPVPSPAVPEAAQPEPAAEMNAAGALEAVVSQTAPAPAEPAAPVADDEVMAALQSLMPVNENEHPANATPGIADTSAVIHLAAIVAEVDSVRVKAHAAGPRWIAEEVALAQEEAALLLEREMEQAYATAAIGHVRAASVVAVIETPQASTEMPAAESAPGRDFEQQPVEPSAAYAMAASASDAGGVHASSAVAMPHLEAQAIYENEIAAAASSAPVNRLSQPVVEEPGFTPSVESQSSPDIEISGGVEDMAASWKNIRDSIASGGGAKPAAAKEKDEAPPVDAAVETRESATASPAPATISSATDPKAIASIVDSVLAELRPKIVEEIARKLADSKKE